MKKNTTTTTIEKSNIKEEKRMTNTERIKQLEEQVASLSIIVQQLWTESNIAKAAITPVKEEEKVEIPTKKQGYAKKQSSNVPTTASIIFEGEYVYFSAGMVSPKLRKALKYKVNQYGGYSMTLNLYPNDPVVIKAKKISEFNSIYHFNDKKAFEAFKKDWNSYKK